MHKGTPISQLRCPTCGDAFQWHPDGNGMIVNSTRPDDDIVNFLNHHEPFIRESQQYYFTCVNGHKWTIQTVWRSFGQYDRVLLGNYIGQEY